MYIYIKPVYIYILYDVILSGLVQLFLQHGRRHILQCAVQDYICLLRTSDRRPERTFSSKAQIQKSKMIESSKALNVDC